jgi:serine/threonine-protein kinase HipA
MNRSGEVYYNKLLAGIISETDEGYVFVYEDSYFQNQETLPISLTLPKNNKRYFNKSMIPFFDGLIPEGWLLNIAVENWKLNPKDRMALLLATCKDCIGAVSIIPIEAEDE